MSLDSFQSLIREFGAKLGVPEMKADEQGYLTLTFDGVEVHLQHDGDADDAVAFARLGEVEIDRAAEIYGMLLGANLFWQGANGATFSLEPDSGIAFLADRRPAANLTPAALDAWLTTFLDSVIYWKKRIADANAGGPLVDVDIPEGAAAPAGAEAAAWQDFSQRV